MRLIILLIPTYVYLFVTYHYLLQASFSGQPGFAALSGSSHITCGSPLHIVARYFTLRFIAVRRYCFDICFIISCCGSPLHIAVRRYCCDVCFIISCCGSPLLAFHSIESWTMCSAVSRYLRSCMHACMHRISVRSVVKARRYLRSSVTWLQGWSICHLRLPAISCHAPAAPPERSHYGVGGRR